jgi:hypothetical protein
LSTGHLKGEKKSEKELTTVMGEGDTPTLLARHAALDTWHDIPYTGGVSVDGKTVYIDRTFYRDLMAGKIKVRGLSSRQVCDRIFDHEHSEWAIDAGDNPVDVYLGAHGFATAKEEQPLKALDIDPNRYEADLEPALKACAKRSPANPPKDLWCGPYLDDPDARDKQLIRIFCAKGVKDAFKASKQTAHYGMVGVECRDCKHYGGGKMNTCELVCGIVRATRGCDWYEEKRK